MGGVITAVICIIGSMIWGIRVGKKRSNTMSLLSEKLGFQLSTERNYQLPDQYEFLKKVQQGSNQYASNILTGIFKSQPVTAFDYHYETYSPNTKGRQQAHHHHFSFFILALEKNIPDLTNAKESFFSTIAQTEGLDDMNIEIDQPSLILWFEHRLKAEEIEAHLDKLIQIYSLMSDDLFLN
jgi:hypothetical protein